MKTNEYKKCKYCKSEIDLCINNNDICIRCQKLMRRMSVDLPLTKRLLKIINHKK